MRVGSSAHYDNAAGSLLTHSMFQSTYLTERNLTTPCYNPCGIRDPAFGLLSGAIRFPDYYEFYYPRR